MTGQPPVYQNDNHGLIDAARARSLRCLLESGEEGELIPPLEIFARLLLNERAIAAMMVEISMGELSDRKISRVSAYFDDIRPRARRIERDALIPVLNKFSCSDDEFRSHINDLKIDEEVVERALTSIKRINSTKCVDRNSAGSLRTMADAMRKRAAIWNGVILPIARVRFDDQANFELRERLTAIANDNQQGERQ